MFYLVYRPCKFSVQYYLTFLFDEWVFFIGIFKSKPKLQGKLIKFLDLCVFFPLQKYCAIRFDNIHKIQNILMHWGTLLNKKIYSPKRYI